ncbi:FG-GAP and VCBS repeat-containing protein [Streptomyces sp. NRRL S-1521]|uniref:FG-GAP and VCBS repeat-containing protein n=1 Tax=Streptomyces sp. NRRL S-1521 TaxID=1609100 RepID=UPI00099ECB48|nr:FG-GAP and VCBS repeat-containing protein [Streptomyces sp. NRRL S-1521]
MRARTLALVAATALAAGGLTLPLAATATAAPDKPVRSDFDGDGYADLAVGVPSGTVDGKAKAGYVSVVFGGPGGPGPNGVRRITQATVEVPGAPEPGDRFGGALTTAYVDDDPYADLIVGAPGEDIDAKTDAGSVTVLYGTGDGFAVANTAARGTKTGDAYGNALAAADFTGDGDVDLAVGGKDRVVANLNPLAARTEPLMGDRMGGRAPVMATGDFDSDGRDDLAVAFHTRNQPYTQSHVQVRSYDKAEGAFHLTWSSSNGAANALAAGDFNGDGRDDLALGNCREIADENIDDPCGPEELAEGGGVHLHYGGANGLIWEGQTLNQDTPGVPGVAETGDDFGNALTAADLDGDGKDDLIAGAPGEAIGSAADAGAVTVLKGGENGVLDTSGAADAVAYQQDSAGVPGTAEKGDAFGTTLATTDYDGDGRPDVSVAAPGENASAGGVWNLPGGAPTGGTNVTPKSIGLPASSHPYAYGAVIGR